MGCLWTLFVGMGLEASAGTPAWSRFCRITWTRRGGIRSRRACSNAMPTKPSCARIPSSVPACGSISNGRPLAWRRTTVTIRLEVRTSQKYEVTPLVKEQPMKSTGLFSRWTAVTLDGDTFHEMGQVIAWRVTLWRAGQQIAEQKSFLW